jgi:hypothetical protein
MTPEQFGQQRGPGQPANFIRWVNKLKLHEFWAESFSMPFFEFRRRLQELARSNLDSVREARISTGLANLDAWINSAEDELIFPVDDDDWFSPDLCELGAIDPDVAMVVWPPAQLVYRPEDYRPILRQLPSSALMTNNWGIRKSFLRKHFDRNTIRRILARHADASYAVAAALGTRRQDLPAQFKDVKIQGRGVISLPNSAGLSLKHLGALTVLLPILKNADPVAEIRSVDFESSVEIKPWVAWAEPWVRRYEALARRCRRG